MDKGNDRNKSVRFWRESCDSDFENSANSNIEDNSSKDNSPFRGFEKEPKVVIEKFNIAPFFKSNLGSTKLKDKSFNGTNKTLPQLVSSCFVKLVREDLEQLKKDILDNSRLKKRRAKGILRMPFLHCKICEKGYGSEKKLQNHLENKHMLVYKAEFAPKPQKRVSFSDHVIVHELKEYHRCRKCTRIFEKYKSLKRHMKQVHRKRKCYICHYCTKNFVDRMFFKVHIKHHCDVCGLLLPNKRRFLMHRRGSCRVVKKYTCKTCQNLFFNYMNLKDHSYDHFENLFVCDVCKAQHSSKCAVTHHILFLHSKKRPKELYASRNLGNERLYLCNFCEASSIDKGVIDDHVSALPDLNNRKRTGYRDYYFCDQCFRKFDTETDMLQHKWSHFLNTYENSQVQPKQKPQRNGTRAKPVNEVRRIFKLHEQLPDLIQPKIVLERIDYVKPQNGMRFVDNNNVEEDSVQITKDQSHESNKAMAITKSKEDGLTEQNGPADEIGLSDKNEIDLTSQELSYIVRKRIDNLISQVEGVPNTKSAVAPTTYEEVGVIVKKAIVDPKSKKTLISKYQCQICHKFYSSNYCLNRHILSMHDNNFSEFKCNDCEENFVWPSLLKTHNCLRMNMPEMAFDDARPEIQLESCRAFEQPGIDDLMNISESEDYMSAVDFEIPEPVVQLTEYNRVINPNDGFSQTSGYASPGHNSYKIVMQQVPIEF